MKKNMLYLGNFSPKTSFAALNRAMGICKLFFLHGYTSNIVVHDFDDSFLHDKYIKENKINVLKVSINKKKFYFSYKWIIKLIEGIGDLKVVVLYNYPSIPAIKITKYCKKKGIKVIGDITEWYDTSNVSLLFKPIKYFDTKKRMKSVNFKMDGLILISNYLLDYYKNRKSLIKIYPLMDYGLRNWNNNKIAASGNYKICYAGIAGNNKDDLLSFVSFLKREEVSNVDLIIVGVINQDVENELKASGINYCYHGLLDHEQTIDILTECDCQVIFRRPSRMNNAGFPTKFAESICLGVPVIATDISDIQSFSSDYVYIIDANHENLQLFLDNSRKRAATVDNSFFYSNKYLEEFGNFITAIEKK